MKLCWTFKSIPELSHLTDDQRRRLVREAVGARTRIGLTARCFVFGMIYGGLPASFTATWWPPGVFINVALTCWALAAAAWWQFDFLRIRSELRQQIKDELRGQRLPACLECGYDLRGSTEDRCPECGAPVRVPAH